jgi:hypothetical protein
VGTSKPKPFFSLGITPDFRITVKVFNPEKSKVIQKKNYKTFEPQPEVLLDVVCWLHNKLTAS